MAPLSQSWGTGNSLGVWELVSALHIWFLQVLEPTVLGINITVVKLVLLIFKLKMKEKQRLGTKNDQEFKQIHDPTALNQYNGCLT